MSTRREKETFEFRPPSIDRVAASLQHLTEAGQGWINLLPGVDLDEEEQQSVQAGIFSLFSNRQQPVAMCTLMPPKPTRRAFDGVTIGVLHPTGGKAVARLAEAGVTLPEGWLVRQDHPRRGLVLLTRHGTSEDEVITWAVRAGTALCRKDMTGEWQAVVYLP